MENIEIIEKLNSYKLNEKERKKFKDRLIKLRRKNGWSQEDVAEKVDVSRQTVSKWESRDTMPEVDKVIKLSKLYDLTIDELLYGNKKDELVENNLDDENKEEINENTQISNNKNKRKLIANVIIKTLIIIITLVLIGYIISVIHNFIILKQLNDKFKSYKDVNNCYYEERKVVSDDTGTLYIVNTKYWYKDGILKREEKKTQNGVTYTGYIYIDIINDIKYTLLEDSKEGIKKENDTSYKEVESSILDYLLGSKYYENNFGILKDALISKIIINEDNYIIERDIEGYKKSIYNKETSFIERTSMIDLNSEETKIIYNIKINEVKDEDIYINFDEYDIR